MKNIGGRGVLLLTSRPAWFGARVVACVAQLKLAVTHVYRLSGANWEKASGAASSKRVRRLRKTNLTLSVGPLRCLAIKMSAWSRSSGAASILKKFGR